MANKDYAIGDSLKSRREFLGYGQETLKSLTANSSLAKDFAERITWFFLPCQRMLENYREK